MVLAVPRLFVRLGVICAVALIGPVMLVAFDRAPSGAREWTPADHDPPEVTPASQQVAAKPAASGQAAGDDPGLVEVAWEQSCSKCHGQRGRGDGPQGPMLRAPDLTRADWQGRVSDQEIADTIRKGRNKMPSFDLPPSVLQGLVKRIRQLKARD